VNSSFTISFPARVEGKHGGARGALSERGQGMGCAEPASTLQLLGLAMWRRVCGVWGLLPFATQQGISPFAGAPR